MFASASRTKPRMNGGNSVAIRVPRATWATWRERFERPYQTPTPMTTGASRSTRTSLTIVATSPAVSNFLLTITMAGVGLGVYLRGLARFGLKAIFIGLAATIVLATFSFALLEAFL